MSEYFYRGRVVAFELDLSFSFFLDQRDYGRAIKICFLPLEAMIHELCHGRGVQRDFSNHRVHISTLRPTIHAIHCLEPRRF